MSAERVISFSPDGQVRCLYSDALPLGDLGQLTISRASEVEFNNQTSQWEVKIAAQVMHRDASRAACIAWEIEFFNRQLLES